MVNLRKKLKALASAAGADEVGDLVSSARSWLDANAPALEAPFSSVRDIGLGTLAYLDPTHLDPNKSRFMPWEKQDGPLAPLTTLSGLSEPIKEPISYGINQGLGIEGSTGPFSGKERKALGTAVGEIDNPLLKSGARAGLGALDIASDPLSWLGPGSLAKNIGQAATFGALSSVGGDVGEQVAGAPGRFAGSVVAPFAPAAAKGAFARSATSGTARAAVEQGRKPQRFTVYRGQVDEAADVAARNIVRPTSEADLFARIRGEMPSTQESAEFFYFTEGKDAARRYAGQDAGALARLRQGTSAPEGAFERLFGRKPGAQGAVQQATIEAHNVLDLADLGEVTAADRLYQHLQRARNGTTEDVDDLLGIGRIEDGGVGRIQPWRLMRNDATDPTRAQRFRQWLQDNGYDAVRYSEDGTQHIAVLDRAQIVSSSPLRAKLKTLASEERGSISGRDALRVGATAAGGLGATQTFDEDDSYWDKAVKVAAGAGAGYVAGTALRGALTPKPQRDVDFLVPDISERLDDIGKDMVAMRRVRGGPLALIGAMRRTFRSGSLSAHQVKGSVDQLGEVVEEAFRNHQIVPTTSGAADVARLRAWVAANKGKLRPELRQRWEDTTTVPAEFILDHWNDRATGAPNFQVLLAAPREVHQAVAGLQGFWQKVESTESALGVPHRTLVDDYLPRAYKRDVALNRTGAGGSRLGARQGFQREREIPTMLEALERPTDKLIPAWNTVGDLFEYRLRAGTRAMAHANVLSTMKANGWMKYGPKSPGTNYEQVHLKDLERLFPYIDRAEAKSILNDFAAGATTRGQAIGKLGKNARIASMPVWVRSDIADELGTALRAAFGDNEFTGSRGFQALSAFVSHLKGVRLAADVAMLGREAATLTAAQATAGGWRTTLNPVAWARASSGIWRAFETSVTRGGLDDYLRDPENRRWANMVGVAGRGSENPILGYEQGQYGIARLPGIGKYTGKLEEWQFNHLIPAMQIETAKTMAGHLARSMPKAEAERVAATVVQKLTGNVDLVALGHGPGLREIERLLMLSPGWSHGMLGAVTGAAKLGPEGMAYRRFWVGTALGAVTSVAGLSLLLTGNASPEHIWELLDPFGQDSVTNPNGRGFLKIEMPDGNRVDIWGPLTPIFRAITSPIDTGAQEAQRAADKGLLWAAWAGLQGASGFAGEGRGAIDTIPRWFESRRSMPIGIVMDLKANRDYRGRMIADEDTEGRNWWDRAKFVLGQLPPGIAESAGFSTEQSPTPDLAFGRRGTITRGIGSALGLNVSTPNRDNPQVKATVEQFLRDQGTHGGLDPIGKLKRAEDIDGNAKAKFLAEHPEVTDYLRSKRKESAKGLGVPVGRDAVKLYNAQVTDLQVHRDQAIRALGEQRRQHLITGNEYRDRVGQEWDRYIFGKDALGQSILGAKDRDEAQARLEQTYGKRNAVGETEQLLEKWYAIRPADDSRAARDAAAQERTAFIDSLDPATRQRFLERRRDMARQTGGEVYAQYFDAQQVYGEVAKESPYLGMTVEQARKVQDTLERARQRSKFTGVPVGSAIMLDPQADVLTKVRARQALGGKLTNPRRRLLWQQHADVLAPFYSDLMGELMEDMAG